MFCLVNKDIEIVGFVVMDRKDKIGRERGTGGERGRGGRGLITLKFGAKLAYKSCDTLHETEPN